MRTSLAEDRKAFKQAMCQLEEQIFDRATEWARNIYKAILEYLDELILCRTHFFSCHREEPR